jgi:hypothetical protein
MAFMKDVHMKSHNLPVRRAKFVFPALFVALMTPADQLFALDQMELDTNRALWDSHNITSYDYHAQLDCFCTPEAVRPAIVSVRLDSIVSVVDAQTFEPRGPADFLTIDAMFDRLQHGLNSDELTIDAQFDSTLGHPRFFRIDNPVLGDDDYSWAVESLTVVPEPSGLAISLITLAIGAGQFQPRRRQFDDF